MWQDWLISTVQWGFILSMLPTIFDKSQKPAVMTSVFSALGLYVFSATYMTLGLWAATVSSFVLASEWALLAYQRHRLNKTSELVKD